MIEMQILARILLPVQPTHRVTHAFSLLWQKGGLCKTDSYPSSILQPGDAFSRLLRCGRGRPGALGMVGAEKLGPAVRFCRPGPALHEAATFAFVSSSPLRLRRASRFPGSSGESRQAGEGAPGWGGGWPGRAEPSPAGRGEAGRGGGGPGSH